MFLTWLIIGLVATAAAVITVSVVITTSLIINMMREGSNGFDNAFSAEIESKLKDGNHTKIKVKLSDIHGNKKIREIKSEYGANVYVGQKIYK